MPRCGWTVKSGRYGDAVGLRIGWTESGSRAGAYAAVVALCLVGVSCSSGEKVDSTSATSPGRSESPPFDLATMTGAAGRGDDLVVVQEGTNRAAIRWADGSWSEAPGIDAEGFWFYRTVGPTVVAGGYECDSLNDEGGCEGAEPLFYRLEDDGWQELDAPEPSQPLGGGPLDGEVELTAVRGPRDWGLFRVGGADTYLVDARGEVDLFDHGFMCAVDDTVVSAAENRDSQGGPVQEGSFDAFELRSLSAPSDPPVVVAVPEPIPILAQPVCGAGHVSVVTPGGSTEWALDVSEATVTRIESNSNEARIVGVENIEAGAATSPDGNTLFQRTGPDGRTMRRIGLGPWEDTGLELSGLWATDSDVIGLETATGTLVELPAT